MAEKCTNTSLLPSEFVKKPKQFYNFVIELNQLFFEEKVKSNNLDLGIGFDADGDRIGFVDDEANIISPDQIIMIFGKYLNQFHLKVLLTMILRKQIQPLLHIN